MRKIELPYFEVAAFASRAFSGNPAGVCILKNWLSDSLLQSIAAENNLSETAFLVAEADGYRLRWFTPRLEVDLCGHATLAAAHVLFSECGAPGETLRFITRSGWLSASRQQGRIELDFPSLPPSPGDVPAALFQGLGVRPSEVLRANYYFAVFEQESDVTGIEPDLEALSQLDLLGVIVTAPGKHSDFVSRFFAPRAGIPEDPVTGSAHSVLIPYWSGKLGLKSMFARQLSPRGGEIHCQDRGERVAIAGDAVTYCRGKIEVPAE